MITYLQGDATAPGGDGTNIIAHICNNKGKWGAGFVLALSARNREPERAYKDWFVRRHQPFELGQIQMVPFAPRTWVCNMIAQDGFGGVAVNYEALRWCLLQLDREAARLSASLHMPRIGCGLGGGSWERVEPLLKTLVAPVTIYDNSNNRR